MNIDDDDDDDYYRQSTTACCPRQTIPDSCSCPEEAVSAIHGLAAFLAARLDEDEAGGEGCHGRPVGVRG